MTEYQDILEGTLRQWADDIRAHKSERVASLFTEDAVFQGFDRTHSVGRAEVGAYYEKQPVGLTAAYRIQELTPVSADAFLAFVDVGFTRPDGELIPTHLTLALVHVDGGWLIRHYHVSKIDA